MNKLIYIVLISCFALFSAKGQIVINEYTAANYDTYADSYGEYEDWVELYNSGTVSVDLNGWALSDKTSNPLKWIFPSTFNIPAGGVAVIYCSGRDEITPAGEAHSNFKITQTKGNEVFMLSDAGGVFQDSIRVIPNQNSHTRGRETNGSAAWSVFTMGSPNTNNAGAMQEYATTPIFSQVGGYYAAAINITLSSPDPNITIYYTTNGDEPNNTSTQYTTAINIATTSVVKAIAYSSDPNIPSSFIDYHTFFINDTHTIPILSVSGDQLGNGANDLLTGPSWSVIGLEPTGTIEWFDKNGILLDKGTGEYNKHGNDSWAYDQRGFDYVMRDQFGYNYALQDKVFMTKDRDKFQRVIVKAAANDNYPFSYGGSGAHIRDAYVHHLSQLADLRMDERSTTSCILYLNGAYWGVYEMREKVDDSDFTDHYYDQDKNNLQYLKTWGGTWTEYGAPNAQPDWNTFVNYVAANPMINQANYNQAKSEYNTGSLIDYFLLNSYVVCQDWLNWNTAWWRGMDPNGDKKKWRYTLWDMDNTFDHGTNYTGIPSSAPTADPCDASTLGNVGGQGHVPIWNEMLTNQEFHDDYINRWQDLANGGLSCNFMISVLDSMVAVIDPEMPRQIATWGGTYAAWQSNVTDLRDFILARCDSMNSGFVDCDTAITGIFDVTVEIIGVGEVEMSNGNIIDQNNTGWTDQRFGGINLPFEVISGSFDHWEVLPAGAYVYDPTLDTLVINLQGDVTVQAYFVPPAPTRDITYSVSPSGSATTISANGSIINTFPTTVTYTIDELVNISPNLDPLYEFNSWSSDSVILMVTNNPTDSFYASNHDNITLHITKKPTITYNIDPPSTSSTINVDGTVINVFPTTIVYPKNQLVNISPNLDPLYGFSNWDSDSVLLIPTSNNPTDSFYVSNNDTVTLRLYLLPIIASFISGNDTICDNGSSDAEVTVAFSGTPPYTFVYAINGDPQPPITTFFNPYVVKTREEGNYTLQYFSDANDQVGPVSGEALVTVLTGVIANFDPQPDSMTILYTTTQLIDKSEGNAVSWQWNFGDNTPANFSKNPYHTYKDSLAIYQVSLIVSDDQGCIDTIFKHIQITDDYWVHIPNSFTPDKDGLNDKFCISYNGIREATFNFNVYDRFSNLVYSTNNIHDLDCDNGWDGTDQSTLIDLPVGIYIYQISYQDFEGWKHQETADILIGR